MARITSADVAVLIIGYSRPEFLLERIKEARNQKAPFIYVVIDGNKQGEESYFSKLDLSYLSELEKSGEIVLIHRTENLGLAQNITRSITQVSSKHKAVFVVEDDVKLGSNAFQNIVNGLNLAPENVLTVGCFSFFSSFSIRNRFRESKYFSAWGWAITTENWSHYHSKIEASRIQEDLSASEIWANLSKSKKIKWMRRFNKVALTPLWTWDIQMQYTSFKLDRVHLHPISRFGDNLGFSSSRSTNTLGKRPRVLGKPGVSSDLINERMVSRLAIRVFEFVDSFSMAGDAYLLTIYNKFAQTRKSTLRKLWKVSKNSRFP
jgi:hypothetical protein